MKRALLIILLIFPLFVYAEEAKFSKCIDGDTFKVITDKEITVRLLAVDTPEISGKKEYYGKEASIYTCELIKNAKEITLEYDNKSSKIDKYNRTLAWVYVDKALLNDLLVKNGYAKVRYVYDDYKYVDLLKIHEKEAQMNKVGIWKDYKSYDIVYLIVIIILFVLYLIFKNKLKKTKNYTKIKKVWRKLWAELMK